MKTCSLGIWQVNVGGWNVKESSGGYMAGHAAEGHTENDLGAGEKYLGITVKFSINSCKCVSEE